MLSPNDVHQRPSIRVSNHSKHAGWLALVVGVTLLSCPLVHAAQDDDAERENLARISNEIERVQLMVKDAASAAPTGQRVKFRYEWLMRDLQMLRDGIEQHVDAPRQPRPAPALRGDYRR